MVVKITSCVSLKMKIFVFDSSYILSVGRLDINFLTGIFFFIIQRPSLLDILRRILQYFFVQVRNSFVIIM